MLDHTIIQIVPMITDADKDGKGDVHWKSWHETYTDLVDASYNAIMTREKCLWVLKGNERAIRFYERYGFRFDGTEEEVILGTPRTQLRMVYTK